MMTNVMNLFTSMWNSVYSWFTRIVNATGSYNYILGIIFAMFAVRFLLYPFLKSGIVNFGSDGVTTTYTHTETVRDGQYHVTDTKSQSKRG